MSRTLTEAIIAEALIIDRTMGERITIESERLREIIHDEIETHIDNGLRDYREFLTGEDREPSEPSHAIEYHGFKNGIKILHNMIRPADKENAA